MKHGNGRVVLNGLLVTVLTIVFCQPAFSQGQLRRESGSGRVIPVEVPVGTPRELAPIDVTGYWVSLVTEDWEWRMITPPRGNYASVPVNKLAKEIGDQWDYEKADPYTCLPFGAPGLIRHPMRIKLSWDDEDTLRFETDNGEQTRLFHFNPEEVAGGPRSLQGDSVAKWGPSTLRVVTTNLAAGYLRKNGVPYSEDIQMTEYVDRYKGFKDEWIIFTTILKDPKYLKEDWILTTHFRKTNKKGWLPRPCYTPPPKVNLAPEKAREVESEHK